MIRFIKGQIAELEKNAVILENNGMGFRLFVPSSYIGTLVNTGDELRMHTFLYVKEDLMQLYGFLTRDELQLFELLLGVNGIGPKAALGILSVLSADELRFAILADDAASIAKAPGVGKKTAQKLILELKDKLDLKDMLGQDKENVPAPTAGSNTNAAVNDAVLALTALGYPSAEALKAVKKVSGAASMDTEEILKAALKFLF